MTIPCRIKEVRKNIEEAKKESSFGAEKVTLLAVSKTRSIGEIEEAVNAGQLDLGENRVQEILEKYDAFDPAVRWHLIGHLQTNKVKYIVDKVAMIHSLDSLKLAAEIDKQCEKIDRVIPCLVQVNIADEDTKFGLKKEEVVDFLKEMPRFPHLEVNGLMTIGPHVEDTEKVRGVFRELRELKEYLATLTLPAVKMIELSMGMSNDYIVAVREGATMVRVGTTIFGARTYN